MPNCDFFTSSNHPNMQIRRTTLILQHFVCTYNWFSGFLLSDKQTFLFHSSKIYIFVYCERIHVFYFRISKKPHTGVCREEIFMFCNKPFIQFDDTLDRNMNANWMNVNGWKNWFFISKIEIWSGNVSFSQDLPRE